MYDDNLHGVWSEEVKQFALMARVSQDQNAFNLFNKSFTTALTADGDAIFSTHTLIGGGTSINNSAKTLTPTSLEAAIIALRTQVNQAGVVLGGVPSILLVAPYNFVNATKITDSALVSGNAQNDINVFRSAYGIQIYQSPYLATVAGGSDTAWFLLTNNHSITRVIRQGIETALTPWQYSTNRTYRYQANFREAVFCPDYSGSFGSTGTDAS